MNKTRKPIALLVKLQEMFLRSNPQRPRTVFEKRHKDAARREIREALRFVLKTVQPSPTSDPDGAGAIFDD